MSGTVGLILTGIFLIAVIAWALLSRQARDSAWKQLAAELGGEFLSGGLFRGSKVRAQIQKWTVTLDIYSVPSGDSNTTYTRVTAPIENKDGLQFAIFREGLVARLDKKLGMKDIEIGVPDFDSEFVIQGNNETKLRSLLANAKIRQLIHAQPRIRLGLKDNQLRYDAQGVIRDVPRLKSLFELFGEILTQLQG
jgi:hypothetical protein